MRVAGCTRGYGRQRGGFNPDRMADLTRTVSVVPQIVEAPLESPARGFTEVKIVGVGGGGTNAVNRMVETGVQGVEFIAVNTDNQALQMSSQCARSPIADAVRKGFGAGGDPVQGERGSRNQPRRAGPTRSKGADHGVPHRRAGRRHRHRPRRSSPTSRAAARALTVAVVTLPFQARGLSATQVGRGRPGPIGAGPRRCADRHSQRPPAAAGRSADERDRGVPGSRDDVLRHGVQGISDLVDDDRADQTWILPTVKAVMPERGYGADGCRRSPWRRPRRGRRPRSHYQSAARRCSIEGARGVLLNVFRWPGSHVWRKSPRRPRRFQARGRS